jgi:GDPmannose 4,6-dehydratase
MRFIEKPIRFYNAGSSECFGDTGHIPANESTPFKPRSPYAVAKASAHWMVNNYREAYGLFACAGILINHELPLRPSRFVRQKIVEIAARIAQGSQEKLYLGNILIERDWGLAPDYVDAMWRMLNIDVPDDYVIATGRTVSLKYFIVKVFEKYALNWEDYVVIQNSLLRPTDISIGNADPSKAKVIVGWASQVDVDGVVSRM